LWIDRDLVFCRANGDYFPFTSLDTLFHKLLQEAGLPRIRFHDLRHSAATILLTMGFILNWYKNSWDIAKSTWRLIRIPMCSHRCNGRWWAS